MTARTTEPDPETAAKPRRQFGAAYKLKILTQMDAASGPKEVGAILRREGLYSSLVSSWRAQRTEGTLLALAPKTRARRRGSDPPRRPRIKDPLARPEADPFARPLTLRRSTRLNARRGLDGGRRRMQ